MSRPLQVYLDERDLARLDAWARGRGWTKSQASRVAVRALTRQPGHLDETFVAEPRAPYRARRHRSRSSVRR